MLRVMLRATGKVVLGGCVLITFVDTIGHPAVVVGNSMYPTLEGSDARWWKRDFVWLSPWAGQFRADVGDVMTFIPPREPEKVHIKRVTATEGDLVRPKLRNELLIIPAGCCWMESDNPENANDSNIYGPVSRGLIKSRATHVVWPPSRWQKL